MDCIYNLLTSKDRYEDNFEESDEFKSPEEEWNANSRKYIKEFKDILTEGDNFNKVMKGIQQPPDFLLCLTISLVRDKI
ncbi:MAG: hypothetical protein IKO27_08695 [Ruminococcus sp.]|nr:hypothetical protein [Ruminococcus sp.]